MKRLVVDILNLAPAAVLVTVGVSEILSRYVPWLAAILGHPSIWVSVACIVLGVLAALPYLWLMRLRRRLRDQVAMRRADA